MKQIYTLNNNWIADELYIAVLFLIMVEIKKMFAFSYGSYTFILPQILFCQKWFKIGGIYFIVVHCIFHMIRVYDVFFTQRNKKKSDWKRAYQRGLSARTYPVSPGSSDRRLITGGHDNAFLHDLNRSPLQLRLHMLVSMQRIVRHLKRSCEFRLILIRRSSTPQLNQSVDQMTSSSPHVQDILRPLSITTLKI